MHLKSIALVALVATISAGCKCSPDRPTNGSAAQAAASQKKAAARKSRARKSQDVEPGITHRVAHGGAKVAYTVYVPDKLAPDAALPVMVILLDRGQTADRFPDLYNVVRGAKKLGYLLTVLAPPGGKRAHWGHGLCKPEPALATAGAAVSAAKPVPSATSATPSGSVPAGQGAASSDLELVGAVISDLSQNHKVDSTKITVVGVGEGAAMAHRVAAELPSVSSAVLFSPSAECAAPTAPIQPEQGRSVMIVAGPTGDAADASATPPTWERLAFEAWTAAGKCDTANPKTEKDKKGSTTTQSCADGRVVRFVQEANARRGWPPKLGSLYTMRAIHNFLTRH